MNHKCSRSVKATGDGALFQRDGIAASKSAKMRATAVHNHGHLRARQTRQRFNFAGMIHSNFNHQKFCSQRRRQNCQRNAKMIVETFGTRVRATEHFKRSRD